MSFKTGEEVVCIKKGSWVTVGGSYRNASDPITDDIYTISNIETINNKTYLQFKELDSNTGWLSIHFKKLDYNFVNEVLKKAKEDSLSLTLN